MSSRLATRAWVLCALALLALPWALHATPLAQDEEVLLFRVVAPSGSGVTSWTVPVHGWVFEPERSSVTTQLLIKAFVKVLGLPPGSEADTTFRQRAMLFLADSQRWKHLQLRIGSSVVALPRSGSDGHFETSIEVSPLAGSPSSEWIRSSLVMPPGDGRRFEGQVQRVGPEGLGVISDIDDTLKVTCVLDRREMLRNTFLRPFVAIPGLAAVYDRWARAGAVFHYVSGSPWQLYPSLVRFMDDAGFPAGAFHLRKLWTRGNDAYEPNDSDAESSFKIAPIEAVLALHPRRTFILVGDSGEMDPEVYGLIARRFPGRIRHIYIRKAPLANESAARYEAAFKGLPRTLWSTFAEPDLPTAP